jgi:hypothetical protein
MMAGKFSPLVGMGVSRIKRLSGLILASMNMHSGS